MRIQGFDSRGALATAPAAAQGSSESKFAEALNQAVASLAEAQEKADRAAESVATGDLGKLQEAVVAMQEVSLAVELVVSVRNHVVEGIQELLRTQV